MTTMSMKKTIQDQSTKGLFWGSDPVEPIKPPSFTYDPNATKKPPRKLLPEMIDREPELTIEMSDSHAAAHSTLHGMLDHVADKAAGKHKKEANRLTKDGETKSEDQMAEDQAALDAISEVEVNAGEEAKQYRLIRDHRHCPTCNKHGIKPDLVVPGKLCPLCQKESFVCKCLKCEPGDTCPMCGDIISAGMPIEMHMHENKCEPTMVDHTPSFLYSENVDEDCVKWPWKGRHLAKEGAQYERHAKVDQDVANGLYHFAPEITESPNYDVNLAAVITTTIQSIRRALQQPSFLNSIFQGPKEKMHDDFFPASVYAEDREYFASGLEREKPLRKEEAIGWQKKMMYGVKQPDAPDAYAFDRSYVPLKEMKKRNREKNQAGSGGDIAHAPKAGGSMHSKLGWKDITERHRIRDLKDKGSSDMKKVAKLEKDLKKQSAWVEMQARALKFQRQRFEHLLHLLQTQQEAEITRQSTIFRVLSDSTKSSSRQKKSELGKLQRERQDAADWIMRILVSHHPSPFFISKTDPRPFHRPPTRFPTAAPDHARWSTTWCRLWRTAATSSPASATCRNS
jgi:hypothetical protein